MTLAGWTGRVVLINERQQVSKIRPKHVYGTAERIKQVHEECEWIGRNVSRIDPEDPGHLIIYAIPPKKKSRPKVESEEQPKRESRPKKGNGFNRFKEMGQS